MNDQHSDTTREDQVRLVTRTVLVGAAYYAVAILGLRLALVGHQVTPVWPPTGVALVGFLLFGRRIWPGVAAAAFLVNLPLGPSVLGAAGIAVGNTLAPLLAATVLRKVRFRVELNRLRDAMAIVFLAALLGMTVSATLGSLTLAAFHTLAPEGFWRTWWVWWAGDAMGVLAVAPFLLSLRSVRFNTRVRWRRALEAAGLFTSIGILTHLVFLSPLQIEYLVFPLLIWAGWRFGQRGAASAALLTITIANIAAVQGTGPFSGVTLVEKMATLQVFNASVAFACLVLAAVKTALTDGERDLRRSEERISGLLASAPNAILVVGEDGRIQTANSFAEAMFGYKHNELEGLPVDALVPERHRAGHAGHRSDYLSDLTSRPMGLGRDLSGRRKDGTEFSAEIGLSSFSTPEGQLFTCIISDITERKRAEEEIEHLALHDPLTGLANRALFMERLTQALARAERRPSSVAVLYLDLDRFKAINDNFGHDVGDRVLTGIADRLRKALRPEDTAARFGGDEFVVLCEDLEDERHVIAIAERIAGSVAEPIPLNGGEIVVSTSIGIAAARGIEDQPEALLREADAAVYKAKEHGRDRFELFDQDMRARSLKRMRTKSELQVAIEYDQLRLLYQPLVSMDDRRIERVEALVRWEHPVRGLLTPSEFIPLAEETGLIWDLGSWVLRDACRQSVRWEHTLPEHRAIPIAVNLSPRQLTHPDFEDTVHEILDETGAEPKHLSFELTETAFMDPAPEVLEILRRLREIGIHLAIDDFGTGFSSLSHLKQFRVDELKVDRSFVQGLGRDVEDSSIVAAVVNLAHSLGLSATAEGVETSEQVERLRMLGCELAQGFYFARPEPAARIHELFLQPA
ncbi:MAG: EAL domain-containing protein [Actinomycetota bacterium]|nr:EAL domain-containing protein [Actinomycetota bacterium]